MFPSDLKVHKRVKVIDDAYYDVGCSHYKLSSENFASFNSTWYTWLQRSVNSQRISTCSTAWFTAAGCSCKYAYGKYNISPADMPNPPRRLAKIICRKLGIKDLPNCVNVNVYINGSEHIPPHSDDEELFQGKVQPITILSISFGHSRDFKLRWKSGGAEKTISLDSGDVLTMTGMCQRFCKHSVPAVVDDDSDDRLRYNLTYRWLVKHDSSCPQCSQ